MESGKTSKPSGIVRYFVLARCRRCGRKHEEFDNVPQRKDKRDKPIRHTIECDTCLIGRVGADQYNRYLESIKKLGLTRDGRERESSQGNES